MEIAHWQDTEPMTIHFFLSTLNYCPITQLNKVQTDVSQDIMSSIYCAEALSCDPTVQAENQPLLLFVTRSQTSHILKRSLGHPGISTRISPKMSLRHLSTLMAIQAVSIPMFTVLWETFYSREWGSIPWSTSKRSSFWPTGTVCPLCMAFPSRGTATAGTEQQGTRSCLGSGSQRIHSKTLLQETKKETITSINHTCLLLRPQIPSPDIFITDATQNACKLKLGLFHIVWMLLHWGWNTYKGASPQPVFLIYHTTGRISLRSCWFTLIKQKHKWRTNTLGVWRHLSSPHGEGEH